ncbi:hypothetical protein CGZ93_02430 [Enemella dayhoffiae]|uniref:VTT domain-containing protein n=1 Tax=Enemella dayhoffiae TaxID=2016507 RepID=A0A255HC82_9ACTN|nr:VTT domain-containing protein [Enemella dayhoffiae]OYO25315.1 hypothetical protein CGZ93_02430 [Enemella dayhoffiae]
MEWVRQLPLAESIAVLFVIVMLRANATYWIGRGAAAGVIRLTRNRAPSPRRARARQRAEALIARWGVLAVPFSFLTIGIQTAVNAAAGALRMPLRRYLPAVIVGSVIWACLYATAGLAVISAAIGLALHSPLLIGALLVAALVVAGFVLWRRRSGPAKCESEEPAVRTDSDAEDPLVPPTR